MDARLTLLHALPHESLRPDSLREEEGDHLNLQNETQEAVPLLIALPLYFPRTVS